MSLLRFLARVGVSPPRPWQLAADEALQVTLPRLPLAQLLPVLQAMMQLQLLPSQDLVDVAEQCCSRLEGGLGARSQLQSREGTSSSNSSNGRVAGRSRGKQGRGLDPQQQLQLARQVVEELQRAAAAGEFELKASSSSSSAGGRRRFSSSSSRGESRQRDYWRYGGEKWSSRGRKVGGFRLAAAGRRRKWGRSRPAERSFDGQVAATSTSSASSSIRAGGVEEGLQGGQRQDNSTTYNNSRVGASSSSSSSSEILPGGLSSFGAQGGRLDALAASSSSSSSMGSDGVLKECVAATASCSSTSSISSRSREAYVAAAGKGRVAGQSAGLQQHDWHVVASSMVQKPPSVES